MKLAYTGELRVILRITLVNLLLTIATIGLFRFWARARSRRYVLGALTLDGDPIEWTGTGREMFRSFSLTAGLWILITVPFYLIQLRAVSGAWRGFIYLCYIILAVLLPLIIAFGRWRAWRYRLSRIYWRGISANLGGSPWPFMWRFAAWLIAQTLTLFLVRPWAVVSLRRHLIVNSGLGDAQLRCQARSRSVFSAFLLSVAMSAAFVALALSSLELALWILEREFIVNITIETYQIPGDYFFPAAFSGLAVLLWWPCLGAIYHARLFNLLVSGVQTTGTCVRTRATAFAVLRRRLVNAVILVLTLGAGGPLALHRQARLNSSDWWCGKSAPGFWFDSSPAG